MGVIVDIRDIDGYDGQYNDGVDEVIERFEVGMDVDKYEG